MLKSLEPKNVFKYFEEISAIPRGSGHTEKITEYCTGFAKEKGLAYIEDELGNVIIFKGGSLGRENEEPLILQGHLDMVWEKTADCNIDFEKEGLSLETDGDFIFAKGTTLGGDDGVALAICLAVLEDKSLSHPPLEVIFTVDEEIGMLGADKLDTSCLKGKRMINLDSEAENVLWVSCAGGLKSQITFEGTLENNKENIYKLTLTGLHGGHSGAEIHKNYANAACLMGKLLKELSKNDHIKLCEIQGGKMGNAITRECSAVICCEAPIDKASEEFIKVIKSELTEEDKNIELIIENADNKECFTLADSERIIAFLSEMPYGVIKMSDRIEDLVETSLNPGITKTEGNKITVGYSLRSSVNKEKYNLSQSLKALAEKYGGKAKTEGDYPAWEYKENSPLREKMTEIYGKLYGKSLQVAAIHAGLECGILSGKIKGLDCVSIGPDMYDIHTPKERLSISSTERIYKFLLKTLEEI